MPTLVVCPKSVLDVWAGELNKFSPTINYQVIRDKNDFSEKMFKKNITLVIMNYAQLRILQDKLIPIQWLSVILDEGQQIKNPDSKASKATRKLNANNRLILTGTPIENRPLDVWSLMSFAMPGVLGHRSFFTKNFDRRKNPHSLTQLSSRLRPFLLRRTKSQVKMDLPSKTEEEILCNLNDSQRELYDNYFKKIQTDILSINDEKELNKSNFLVIQALLRLRQICCHPGLVDKEQINGKSSKLDALFYLLNQLKEEGHKVLVFSQFVTMLNIIKQKLEEEKRSYFFLTGQSKNRGDIVNNFQNSKDPAVFLLSLKAGGTGLNLTAASYVVLYDPWWNPAVENQAIDRTHRIGQTNPVIAYRIIARNTIEEKIRILQSKKQHITQEILGYESFAKNLTMNDIHFLFSIDN